MLALLMIPRRTLEDMRASFRISVKRRTCIDPLDQHGSLYQRRTLLVRWFKRVGKVLDTCAAAYLSEPPGFKTRTFSASDQGASVDEAIFLRVPFQKINNLMNRG